MPSQSFKIRQLFCSWYLSCSLSRLLSTVCSFKFAFSLTISSSRRLLTLVSDACIRWWFFKRPRTSQSSDSMSSSIFFSFNRNKLVIYKGYNTDFITITFRIRLFRHVSNSIWFSSNFAMSIRFVCLSCSNSRCCTSIVVCWNWYNGVRSRDEAIVDGWSMLLLLLLLLFVASIWNNCSLFCVRELNRGLL